MTKERIPIINQPKVLGLADIYLSRQADSTWKTPLSLFLQKNGLSNIETIDFIKDSIHTKVAQILGLEPGFLSRVINLNQRAPTRIKQISILIVKNKKIGNIAKIEILTDQEEKYELEINIQGQITKLVDRSLENESDGKSVEQI